MSFLWESSCYVLFADCSKITLHLLLLNFLNALFLSHVNVYVTGIGNPADKPYLLTVEDSLFICYYCFSLMLWFYWCYCSMSSHWLALELWIFSWLSKNRSSMLILVFWKCYWYVSAFSHWKFECNDLFADCSKITLHLLLLIFLNALFSTGSLALCYLYWNPDD